MSGQSSSGSVPGLSAALSAATLAPKSDATDPDADNSWVDWPSAARLAGRVVPPGSAPSRGELVDLVGELRRAADRAIAPVMEVSGLAALLHAENEMPSSLAAVHVVDRAQWAVANAESMAVLAGPVLGDSMRGEQRVLGTAVATAESAALLAMMSTRVLGQFDPYGGVTAGRGGRLLLVAPNILEVGTAMGVVAPDFRLWVCLHELTHAAQFRAAPWLADYLKGEVTELASAMTDSEKAASRGAALVRVGAVLRAGYRAARGLPGGSIVDAVLTPDQHAHVDRITAVMALVEGHADVTMDAVGPAIVPSVEHLREVFDQRRQSPRRGTRVIGRLLGLTDKMAQYRDGAIFVRAVVASVGMEGMSAAWTEPALLPTPHELKEPALWVRRVHG